MFVSQVNRLLLLTSRSSMELESAATCSQPACAVKDTLAVACVSQATSSSAPIHKLPRELMHTIFLEVMGKERSGLHCISIFSSVCRRWYLLCQHPILWEFVAKSDFIFYPLVMRLQHTAPLDSTSKEIANAMRLLGAIDPAAKLCDTDSPPAPGATPSSASRFDTQVPTPRSLRQAIETVKRHRARQQYYKQVQCRRSFILHVFLSLTLLSFSLFVASTMCAAEGAQLGLLCTRKAAFTFLWIAYTAIAAIIISNVVMQAHFEPQPLLQRLRRNRTLITASAATILFGICDVIIPTVLIEVNLTRRQRFPWIWCGMTVILSFCLWQCYALMRIMPDAKEHLQQQLTAVNVKEGFQFVILNIPNAFPLLFAAAAFCTLQYVQHGNRVYVLLGGVPVVVSLHVLSLVFLLDFVSWRRFKDLSVGIYLFVASMCPLSVLVWDFRGLCLLPLALASFGFFVSHAHYMVSKAFGELTRKEAALHGCSVT